MSTLTDIPIQVEQSPPPPRDFGNALPILGEIRHAVARLAETDEATRIDLASIPFGPGDEDRLLELLGRGEVQATVNALGPTRIWETRFPGVWLVDYANADDQRLALQIEVDEVPQILRTQRADLSDSLSALDASVEAASRATSPAPESSAEPPPESGTDSGTPAL
jgi:hydrogenase-1 operon protein HyaF